jgi:hypothetical protein
VELAQATPSVESVVMLLSVDPATLRRDEAVAGAIGLELAQRMLSAVAVRFQAQAAGLPPKPRQVDEAAAELSAALGMHPLTASARVSTSRSLARRLPTTLKALEAGELSLRQAESVERATRELDVTDAQAVEAAAVPGGPRRLAHRLQREIARVAPELVKQRTEAKRVERGIDNWSDPVEGVAGFGLMGPLAKVAQIKAAIDMTARRRVAGECRPIAARRFDVLLAWAREKLGLDRPADIDVGAGRSAAGSRPGRVPISVTVSAETLLRLSEAPGELDGYGPIPAEVARELAADGEWRRWLLEPSGRLADVGGRTYRPSAKLDRYVRGRDRTCRFPTCTMSSERCDLDHTLAFHTEDGETSQNNLVALCRHHHRLKHETDWTYTMEPNGDVVWTAPSGRSYTAFAGDHADDAAISTFLADCSRRDRDKRERRRQKQRNDRLPRIPTQLLAPYVPPKDGSEPPF